MSLYEGTNGIQSADLLGRKMTLRGGACFDAFRNQIDTFCQTHRQDEDLGDGVRILEGVSGKLWETALEMKNRRDTDPLQWASATYPALTAFGDVAMAWRLLDLALIAMKAGKKKGKLDDFQKGKVYQARYFVNTTLGHTLATIDACLNPGREVVEIPDAAF
jgi:hypothetical protein